MKLDYILHKLLRKVVFKSGAFPLVLLLFYFTDLHLGSVLKLLFFLTDTTSMSAIIVNGVDLWEGLGVHRY